MRVRASSHPGRVIVVAAAAAMLALTMLVGAARANFPLAFAPAPFDGPTLRQAVTEQLRTPNGTAPLGLASALVAREPMRRGNLSLLGATALTAGEGERSNLAFSAAARLGWRDPAAQYWAVVRALEAGQSSVAADRMEALLRLAPNFDATDQALVAAMADPATAADLIRRTSAARGWPEAVVRRIGSGSGPANAARLALIEGACARPCRFDGTLAADMASSLFARDPALAQRVWRLLAGPGTMATSGMWDGRMTPPATDRDVGPFEWRLLSSDRWQTRFDPAAGGITAEGSAQLVTRLADTHIVVAPGAYRVTWQASVAQDGRPDVRIAPVCAGPEFDLPFRETPSQGTTHGVLVVVPANCSVVQLRAIAFPDGGNQRWLRTPRINPI